MYCAALYCAATRLEASRRALHRTALRRRSTPLPSLTTHLADASGILRFRSGSEAHEAHHT
eukprot:527504-Prorocentrum_minimum.AAC.1